MAWLVILSSLALAQSQDYYIQGGANPATNQNGASRQSVEVQPSVNWQYRGNPELQIQELRQPVNMIPQFGQNIIPLNRPSPDLEPPNYSNNRNSQNPDIASQIIFPDTPNRFTEPADDKRDDLQRPVAPAGGMAPPPPIVPMAQPTVNRVSVALSQFGINIMKALQQKPGNIVMSPYSIGTALALLQQGALGETQQQISRALQMAPKEAVDGFKNLSENFKKRRSDSIFTVGNGLFIADAFTLNRNFKRTAINDFGSDITPVKFSRSQQAADKINSWISQRTNNKIDKLVRADSLGDNTQLILANAVYFKGKWQTQFRPESTFTNNFFLRSGDVKPRQFMRARRYLNTSFDSSINSRVVELPFEGEQISLIIILPSESSTVDSVIASLTPESLLASQNMMRKEVKLQLPKFTIKVESNLVDVFQKLGIRDIFGPASELLGLGSYQEFAPQVSSAEHSALLSIDEEGGVATAATTIGAVALSYEDPSVQITVDRPFLAVLWDKMQSVPLFMAKIEDPQ